MGNFNCNKPANGLSVSMIRCARYARFSSDLQKDQSIQDQLSICDREVEKRGWSIIEEYTFTDNAVSGASVKGRKGLEALLNAAERKPRPFDYVLVESTSRLSRVNGENDRIIEELHFHGINVLIVTSSIDTAHESSADFIAFSGVQDSKYGRDLKKFTVRGMVGAASRGFNAGGRLYGYKYERVIDPTGVIDRKTNQPRVLGTSIEVDDNQAAVVKEVFDLYVSGLSVREITFHLNSKNYPPPFNSRQLERRGKAFWLPGTVRSQLGNPKYIGDWTFNKKGWRKNPKTGAKRFLLKDRSNWEIIQRPDLEIVSQEVWDKAQSMIELRKRGPQKGKKQHSSNFLLSGYMKCDTCGGNYVIVTGMDRPNPRFGCSTKHSRGLTACDNNYRIDKLQIEKMVLSTLQKQLLKDNILMRLVTRVNQKLKVKLKELQHQSPELLKEQKDLESRKNNLWDELERGFATDVVRSRIIEIENRLKQINIDMSTSKGNGKSSPFKVDLNYIKKWVEQIGELANTDVMTARSRLMTLVGPLTLKPFVADGVKYLKTTGNVKLNGLLMVATGQSYSKMLYTGGQI